MGLPGRDLGTLSGADEKSPPVDTHPDQAADDGERLGRRGMHMLSGDRPAGGHVQVAHGQVAVARLGCDPDDPTFTGDRIVQYFSDV